MTHGYGQPEVQVYCPADRTPMQKVNDRGVTVDVCPACQGTFLNAGELQQIIATVSRQPGFNPAGYAPAPHASHGQSGQYAHHGHHRRRRDDDSFFGDLFD